MNQLERRVRRAEQGILGTDPSPTHDADMAIWRLLNALREDQPRLDAALNDAAQYDHPPLNALAAHIREHGERPPVSEWRIPESAWEAMFAGVNLTEALREMNQRRAITRDAGATA